MPLSTPAAAFEEARKIIDNKVEGPKSCWWHSITGAPLVGVHNKQAHNFVAAFFCVGSAGSLK